MKATAWKGGSYGIRVGQSNAKSYFPKQWSNIDVSIAGQVHSFPLSPTFWTTCPEFRGASIEQWLRSHKLIPWPHRKPPQVTLTHLGPKRFRLSYP